MRGRIMSSYQPGPKEELLWERVKQNCKQDETVRLVPIVDGLGMDHVMARNYVKKWENRGLIKLISSTYLKVTRKGRQVDDLHVL